MSLALDIRADQADAGQALLEAVRALGPGLAARAAEFEAARRMPPDVIEALRAIGVFRMYAPRSHGGLELDFPTSMEVLIELAKIDGSLGWTGMIGAGSAPFLGRVSRERFERAYAGGPDVILAGSAAPTGLAARVDGGLRVTGRWAFASGCQHADLIFAGCIVTEDGSPLPGRVEGIPLIKHVVLPAERWTIEDTWKVAGLKGTGSHHIALKDEFVSDADVLDFGGPSCVPGPLHLSPLHLVPLMHCAPAIGIAEAALEELTALAATGKRQFAMNVSMKDSQLFQAELGRLEAEIAAARAYLEARMERVWSRLLAGDVSEPGVKGQQTAAWVTNACLKAVDGLYALGGGSALYDDSPLQRRLRDIHAAAQHTAVQPRHYAAAGALRLGHPPPPSPFG